MDAARLQELHIDPELKRRPVAGVYLIIGAITVLAAIAAWFALTHSNSEPRVVARDGDSQTAVAASSAAASGSSSATTVAAAARDGAGSGGSSTAPASRSAAAAAPIAALPADVVLTVSGYIINRERIELSPRFAGVVKWIGVKKGDTVTKDQVIVLLDDSEQKARVAQAEARVNTAKVAVARGELDLRRANELRAANVNSEAAYDRARLDLDTARAELRSAESTLELERVYLDWTVIKSPIDGVVLEKLADPGELVMPQSFGGPRGPSTALVALADPADLQVEIDVNEADLAKVRIEQPCRVIPEAFQDKRYNGVVAEIAPEANRAKGTLQVRVQIQNPDRFLIPELSARVEFLAQ